MVLYCLSYFPNQTLSVTVTVVNQAIIDPCRLAIPHLTDVDAAVSVRATSLLKLNAGSGGLSCVCESLLSLLPSLPSSPPHVIVGVLALLPLLEGVCGREDVCALLLPCVRVAETSYKVESALAGLLTAVEGSIVGGAQESSPGILSSFFYSHALSCPHLIYLLLLLPLLSPLFLSSLLHVSSSLFPLSHKQALFVLHVCPFSSCLIFSSIPFFSFSMATLL